MVSALITRHVATVFVEEEHTDARGNVVMRPGATGVAVRCTITARAMAADKSGTDAPRWALLAPPETPLGRWSRVECFDRVFAVVSWPRLVGPAGSAAQHVAAELVEQR